MAFAMVGSFVAGFGAGWAARSVTRSTRGALVGIVAGTYWLRDELSRILGQTMEWSQDLLAEARAVYETETPEG